VVVVTALFSFSQQAKSAKLMEGFLKMQAQEARIIRNGQIKVIDATKLVVGDIVDVRSGDRIPADIRVIFSRELKVDNSSLTGEAEPQIRSVEMTDTNPLETQNLAFFSTLVSEGDGIGLVVRTGDSTIIGNIAGLATQTKTAETPLQHELHRFIKMVSVVAVALGLLFFGLGFAVKINWLTNVVFVI
jgi:sodium/potassium-transporting ATPase subunit alpha